MIENKIVVTGIGVIGPNGTGKEGFFEAIFKGASGIKPISLFDTSLFEAKTAGEIKDFSPEQFLGAKGLRNLDRSTKLVASATKLALDDGGLKVTAENSSDIGVVIGTTLGSLKSICDFDREALTEGVRYVNPALFPNTVINSPASEVSIKFNLKGFNTTISTGFSASLDAIGYACDFLRLGRAKVVLAGGVEELCLQAFLGFYKTKFLAGLKGEEVSCPFDKRRNGFILGEGAAVLVLETLSSALERKANIYAGISGFATVFNSLKKSMQLALEEANLKEPDIDYISAAANSGLDADLSETLAIKGVFGKRAQEIFVSAIKSMTGECFSASGVFQALAAIGAIAKQKVPPTINYQERDPACDLNYVTGAAKECRIKHTLVNAFALGGGNSSLVVSSV